MAKDPKKLNPENPYSKTYPGQDLNNGVLPKSSDLLPSIFRTETNKKVLSAVVEDLFQPSSIETLNYTIGRNQIKFTGADYLPHPTARRQLETGLVVFNETGAKTLSSDDIATAWNLNERTNETAESLSVLDLPIDPDKFLNWSDYYWIEERMPIVYLTGGVGESLSIQHDIAGKKFYTSPVQNNGRTLEFKNGMRVVFQQHPLNADIDGNLDLDLVTDGTSQLLLDAEFINYDRKLIGVSVDGTILTQSVDYFITGNAIQWINVPTNGQAVHVHAPDYFVTADNATILRIWVVAGVGTESGIQFLGLHSHFTSTVYSNKTDALWDQSAVPWDRIEWDGFNPGINPKQYILQELGAKNKNAHSRTNCWFHKSTIQTTVNFLGISFTDIAKEESQALRPIIEFENTLELYNHGVRYRHWPTFMVNESNVSILDFQGLPVTDTNTDTLDAKYMTLLSKLNRPVDVIVQTSIRGKLKLSLNADSVTASELAKILLNLDNDNANGRIPKYAVYKIINDKITWIKNAPVNEEWIITYRISGVLLSALRILWLTKDLNVNKILNVRTEVINDRTYTGPVSKETANDGDAVAINVTSTADPHYLKEYYWKDGVATLATFRNTATQQPLFELYDRDAVKLSDATGFKPSIVNSNIIKIKSGSQFDDESGYNLDFLETQFTQLSANNVAADNAYNILYEHTLQTPSLYTSAFGVQETINGPYSFRRYQGEDVISELSNGYRRAWCKLKSWAVRSQQVTGATTIQLDESMWPTYNWAVKISNGTGTVLHVDDNTSVVDNTAVGARGHKISFKVYHNGLNLTATISGLGFDSFDVQVINGMIEFLVPESAVDTLTVTNGFISFTAKLIDIKQDPRFIKITLGKMPIDYTVDSGAYTVSLIGKGAVEIYHQGNQVIGDHLTAIPGFDYNPEQQDSLGNISVARLVKGLSKNIAINTSKTRKWIDGPKFKTLDGIYMVDNSAIRSSWANFALNPGMQDVLVARSMSAWRWHRKFISKIEESNRLYNIESNGIAPTLDRILGELLLGVNYSSADAVSGMAFTREGMQSNTITASGEAAFDIGSSDLFTRLYAADHVYVYLNNSLQLNNVDYTIADQQVIFTTAPAADSLIEIYFASETEVYSGIPSSPAKLGLSGLYVPQLVTETWGNNSRTFIQRHDGSMLAAYVDPATELVSADYVFNALILELEKRIYNACVNSNGKTNRQRSIKNYSSADVSESQARSQLEWYSVNGIDYRDRADFNANDAWTWNYGGKSWRRLYLNMFGTYRLHDAPWESLGFDTKPTWWDAHYSWTDTNKRVALERALYFGILNEPGLAAFTDPNFVHSYELFPVDVNGNLSSPFAAGIASPTSDEAQQPWEIGSMGPAELAYRRSASGAWSDILHIIDDYSLVNKFFDSAINPFVLTVSNNSTAPKGTSSIVPDQFLYQRPLFGIGAALFEGYREFNLLGESPLNELLAIGTRLEFSTGGFTDGNISLKMPYTKFQDSDYVPLDDFNLTLSSGVSSNQLRYTSVRIEKDDVGFRVYGFDPGQRFFKVLTPTAKSLSVGYPTSRKQLATSYGTFVEYLDWNTTPVAVPYGSYVANKQDLITLLMGLGEYQKQQGLVLDSINDSGTVADWKQAAIDAITWSEENWSNEHYCTVGVATTDGLKLQHTMGTLSRLDADQGRTGKILYANGRSATAGELLITRDFETNLDKVSPLTDEQIVFVNFKTQNYDHVFFINKTTKFGDLLVDLQTGNRLEDLTISGRRTYNWTGRPRANGVIPQQYTSLPGFDTLVDDIFTSHMPERVAFDTMKTAIARSDIVPSKQSAVFDIIQDSSSAYLYRQGLQASAGTNLAIDALFRNRNIDIPGSTQDVSVNEQWMFSTGDFGNLANKKTWEIELRKSDLTSNRQIVRFRDAALGVSDLRSDNIIDIVGKADPRWVSRPMDHTFGTINRTEIDQTYSKANNWLPSAGLANVVDTDIEVMYLSELTFDKLNEVERSHVPFNTRSFNRYSDYNQGDHAWNQGKLYQATAGIVGSAISAFDTAQWIEISTTGSVLPSVWVSDYGFTMEQGVVAGSDSIWIAEKLYSTGDVVYINENYYKCVDSNVQSIFNQLELTDILVLNGGTGYTDADSVVVAPLSGLGSGATAELIVKDGFISAIAIDTKEKYRIDTTSICNDAGEKIATPLFESIETIDVIDSNLKQLGNITGLNIGNNYDPDYVNVQLRLSNGSFISGVPKLGNKIVSRNKTGVISVFAISNGGNGYSINDEVTASNLSSGYDAIFRVAAITTGNTQADATATIVDGSVDSISITEAGKGYITQPLVIIDGDGEGATATAVITNGALTSIEITEPGTGYTTAPTVIISAPTNTTGSITALDITYSGAFYELQEYELTGGASIVVTGVSTLSGPEYVQENAITEVSFDNVTIPASVTTGTLFVTRLPHDTLNGNTSYRRAEAIITGTSITGVSLKSTYGAGSTGYPASVTVTIRGDGSGATAVPIFANNKITGFTVTSVGEGYSYANVIITDPDWATGIQTEAVSLTLNTITTGETYEVGTISSVIDIAAADGYTVGQELKIVDTSGYNTDTSGASVSAVNNGVITNVTLTNTGAGYSLPPTVAITSANGAGAILSVDTKNYWEILPQGYGWNVLQTFAPAYIEEICPNALEPGLNESKVSFASPHRLTAGSYIIIAGCNDGNYDAVHKVKAVVDDYNVLIAARSTSDTVVYNAVGFKLSSVKFKTDEEFLNSSLVFSAGMKAYVDYGDIEGRYKIYSFTGSGRVNLQNYQAENYSNTMIDSGSIYQVQLFDYSTSDLVETLEVFDPYKGLTIDDVAQYIDFKQLPDPAVYNVNELGQLDEYAAAPWGSKYVGKLWWDLDKVRYIEYEQSGDVQYRATHWGERFANSEVAVYEWTSSASMPTLDSEPDAFLDTSGNSEGQVRYNEINTVNPSTGAVETTYYFWKRSPSTVPAGSGRTYSAAAIQSVLNNPDGNGVSWFAPIDTNAFIISNISGLFGNRDKLVLRIEQDKTPEQSHSNNVLVTENADIINDYLYNRLAASVVGRDNYREAYKLKEYVVGTTYFKGDYVYIENNGVIVTTDTYSGTDYPILQNLDDVRYNIQSVRKSKDNRDHKIYYVIVDNYVANGIDADVNNRSIIKSAASALIKDPYENSETYYAVINTRRRVPDPSLHPLRRYGNAYVPKPQSWFNDIVRARRTLAVAANEYLLNIDTVSKTNWDRYLRTYHPLGGTYSKDLTKYWYYVDYVSAGYTVGNENIQITANQISLLDSTVTSFAVVDEYDNIVEAYTKSGNDLILMYRQNGTIQFSNAIWDGSLGDAWDRVRWDSGHWDEDASEVVESILRALRNNIFVGTDINYFNKLFFALVKESLAQIPTADWIVKTTYLDVTQTSDRELEQVGTYYNKKDKLIGNYIDEVKPFHSKVIETNKQSYSQQEVNVSVGESVIFTTSTYYELTAENNDPLTTEDGRKFITEPTITVQAIAEQ